MRVHSHPANVWRHDNRDFGARVADHVTGFMGSWKFVIVQSVIVVAWIICNVIAWSLDWDPYPFILLNLAFSTQSAYAAPLILLASNRSAEADRLKAEHDYDTNVTHLKEFRLFRDDQFEELMSMLNTIRKEQQ